MSARPVPTLRVLWTHNFDPDKPNSQVYMNTAAAGVRARGVDLHLEYLGNLRSIPNVLRARRRVRELSKEFDLVHAQYGSACALATTAAVGVPRVLSIRGNDWSVHRERIGFYYIHTRLARVMTRLAIRRYDCVISVSNRMAGELRRVTGVPNVVTIPSPIDVTRFVPRDKREARAELGFAGDQRKWILFNALNLNDPIKRFPLAKAAFEMANAKQYRLGLNQPAASPTARRAIEMAEAINRETGGEFRLEVFPESRLGPDPKMFADLRGGARRDSLHLGDRRLAEFREGGACVQCPVRLD